MKSRSSALLLLLLLLNFIGDCSARSSRGGSSRYSSSRYSSSRYSSSRSYSRVSATRVTSLVRSSFRRTITRSALRSSFYLTSLAWRRRYYRANTENYNEDYTLCFNIYDAVPAELNDSIVYPWFYKNNTVYGIYACPISDDWRVYCCGSDLQQNCCGFWDDGERVAGVVVGIVFGVLFIAGATYWWLKHYVKPDCLRSNSVQTTAPSVSASANSVKHSAEGEDFAAGDFIPPPPPPKYEDVA